MPCFYHFCRDFLLSLVVCSSIIMQRVNTVNGIKFSSAVGDSNSNSRHTAPPIKSFPHLTVSCSNKKYDDDDDDYDYDIINHYRKHCIIIITSLHLAPSMPSTTSSQRRYSLYSLNLIVSAPAAAMTNWKAASTDPIIVRIRNVVTYKQPRNVIVRGRVDGGLGG